MSTTATDTGRWLRPPDNVHAGWQYEIRCDIVGDDEPVDVAEISAKTSLLLDALRASRHGIGNDTPLMQIAEQLELLRDDTADPDSSRVGLDQAIREMDGILEELYDWGDSRRVIINLGA